MLKLTRELRFGLHPVDPTSSPNSANGFAANPALVDIAPFLTLTASLTGALDPATGMLINIKIVDQLLRQHAVPLLRDAYYVKRTTAAKILPKLFAALQDKFSPHILESLTLALSPFLRLSINTKEPRMILLTQRFEFSAAHRLHSADLSESENQRVFGRCNNPNGHGHNYELEVTIIPNEDEAFSVLHLQKIVNQTIIDNFDHKHLNLDCVEFRELNPTVENIAKVIYLKLKPAIPAPVSLAHVRVWETPKTVAEYGE